MRTLIYPIMFAFVGACVVVLSPYVEMTAEWFAGQTFVVMQLPPSWGICASIVSSVMAFGYVIVTQNQRKAGLIRRYRWAEERLMYLGKMSAPEILDYHRSYNWHAYAGLGFSTVFILVTVFLSNQLDAKLTGPVERFAMFLGLGMLGVSTIILGITDFFHTNTLTPLITIDRRFALMDIILKLGGLALMLQLCAVGVFLSLINSWLSIITSISCLGLLIFITERRGVPTKSLAWERRLTEADARAVEDA